MARYFFDVIDGTGVTVDEEGQVLPTLFDACEAAIEGIRSILREDISLGFLDFSGRIVIRDSNQRLLTTIRFRDAVRSRGLDDMKDIP